MVAFRGSVGFKNYLLDARFAMSRWPDWPTANLSICPNCKVHNGAAVGYRSIRDEMWAAIDMMGCFHLDFSGHSLGGALVSLASLEARHRQATRVDRVYTFAKPRVGNLAFVEAYRAAAGASLDRPPMWRIVGYRDPVPQLPMITLLYVHEPLQVYYHTDYFSSFVICPTSVGELESANCSYSVGVMACLRCPGRRHNMYFNLSTDVLPRSCSVSQP